MLQIINCERGKEAHAAEVELTWLVDVIAESNIRYVEGLENAFLICSSNCKITTLEDYRFGIDGDFIIAGFYLSAIVSLSEEQIKIIEENLLKEKIYIYRTH